MIDTIRDKIDIDLRSMGGRRNKVTIAFDISYEDSSPEKAYGVTNELVTLFLNENVKSRVERATETTDFLKQESNRLKENLNKMESLVAVYKKEHADALPEHLSMKERILQRSQNSLFELNRNYKATESELSRLDLELTSSKSGGTDPGSLSALKTEYREARVHYKDSHPTIKSLKRRIETLENSKTLKKDELNSENMMGNEFTFKLQTLINTGKQRLLSLEEQRKPLLKKIARLEKEIIKTPQVQLGLSELLRDHTSAKKKYEEIQSKQLTAQVAENLESENKSERFSLIEPPTLADRPIKPNRMKIIGMGFFLAIAAAIGIAFFLEVLNQRVRGSGALTAILGESPLVEIPYITTSDEDKKRKMLIMRASISFGGLVIISLVAVHFLYMNLDILLYKILARLG